MTRLLPLLLLTACAPAEQAAHNHTVTAEMVGEHTTDRRETLVMAEHAYTGASIAALQLVAHADEGELEELESLEMRAGDALIYLRTLSDAPDEEFLWALYHYNITLADLNAATEGQTHAAAASH